MAQKHKDTADLSSSLPAANGQEPNLIPVTRPQESERHKGQGRGPVFVQYMKRTECAQGWESDLE